MNKADVKYRRAQAAHEEAKAESEKAKSEELRNDTHYQWVRNTSILVGAAVSLAALFLKSRK